MQLEKGGGNNMPVVARMLSLKVISPTFTNTSGFDSLCSYPTKNLICTSQYQPLPLLTITIALSVRFGCSYYEIKYKIPLPQSFTVFPVYLVVPPQLPLKTIHTF